jgi:hypothetical protein
MHHLIFEGADLAGKSWIMSQVYDYLEPKYNKSGLVLDGCHWFNCDVGVYGTELGRPVIEHYLGIMEALRGKNILIEKLHLADIVYNRLHRGAELDYSDAESRLSSLGFKIILVELPEDVKEIKKRIQDRLNLYPHYERILQSPRWYIRQQKEFRKETEKTSLPCLNVETEKLPDENLIKKILGWIKEVEL